MIKAIHPKHQSMVNKATKWLIKYNALNDIRDSQEDELSKEWRQANKKCEDAWDKFCEWLDELPKREQENITKSELY